MSCWKPAFSRACSAHRTRCLDGPEPQRAAATRSSCQKLPSKILQELGLASHNKTSPHVSLGSFCNVQKPQFRIRQACYTNRRSPPRPQATNLQRPHDPFGISATLLHICVGSSRQQAEGLCCVKGGDFQSASRDCNAKASASLLGGSIVQGLCTRSQSYSLGMSRMCKPDVENSDTLDSRLHSITICAIQYGGPTYDTSHGQNSLSKAQ